MNQIRISDFNYTDASLNNTFIEGYAEFNSSATFNRGVSIIRDSAYNNYPHIIIGNSKSLISQNSVELNSFTYGDFIHDGNIKFGQGNSSSGSIPTTFDLSANSDTNGTGIRYNGPINIGSKSSNTFNISSNALTLVSNNFNASLIGNSIGLNYIGNLNISSNNANITLKNGTLKTDSYNFDVGNENRCTMNVVAHNNTGPGITYDGPINIGTNASNTFNMNANGTLNYSGLINVFNELRIKPGGNFVIEASNNAITYLKTEVRLTEQINVSNDGTGPALVVNQTDSMTQDIAQFKDNNKTVLSIGNQGDTRISGKLYLGYDTYIYDISSNDIIDPDYTFKTKGNGNFDGNITLSGNVTALSDIRLKTNLEKLTQCCTKIKEISGYKYERIDNHTKNIGLIAQEVEKDFPELITTVGKFKSVNYQSFVAVLLEAIKELEERISILEKK
jgi:hypothetical protein